MTYFTSDLHLGHANIIKLCQRPFENVDEMDEALIENWNRKVHKNDVVYVLGDVVWDKKRLSHYMERLSGKKILIAGNHDVSFVKKSETEACFNSIHKFLETNLNCHPVTMCHYPMLEWKASREELPRKLGYHLHGHIHNRVAEEYRPLFLKFNALNVGVDVNSFEPVTFEELLLNNMRFKFSALTDTADKEFLKQSFLSGFENSSFTW